MNNLSKSHSIRVSLDDVTDNANSYKNSDKCTPLGQTFQLTTSQIVCQSFLTDNEAIFPGLQLNDEEESSVPAVAQTSDKIVLKNQEIKTILRIRPCPKDSVPGNYTIKNNRVLEVVVDNSTKSYTFTETFGEEISQENIFTKVCLEPIDNYLDTYRSGLIFTYGMTCSGKTFTIMGSDENPGILPRSMEYILGRVTSSVDVKLFCNFYEIYNEECYDLLTDMDKTPDKKKKKKAPNTLERKKLILKEANKQVNFVNVTQPELKTIADFKKILNYGIKQKTHAPTLLNENSSRSHTVFKLIMINANFPKATACFSIVDLAGSERAKRTEATGINLVEAAKINLSLSVLGKCLEAMRTNSLNKKKVLVPFRESKLTMLFQEYFYGNNHIIMITNINPRKEDYEESIRALGFSCLCKEIVPAKSIIIRPSIMPIKREEAIKKTSINNQIENNNMTIAKSGSVPRLICSPKAKYYEHESESLLQQLRYENEEMKRKLHSLENDRRNSFPKKEPNSKSVLEDLGISNAGDSKNFKFTATPADSDQIKSILARFTRSANLVIINPTIEGINIFCNNKKINRKSVPSYCKADN